MYEKKKKKEYFINLKKKSKEINTIKKKKKNTALRIHWQVLGRHVQEIGTSGEKCGCWETSFLSITLHIVLNNE